MSDDSLEAWQAEDAWLRRVAGALVRDPHVADDLAQDAWVTGLAARRVGSGARHWLRGALRHLAVAHRRREAARAHRERAAAREPDVAAADEVLAATQWGERVIRELEALEEPLRTAVALRVVQGLTLDDVAQRMGVAPSTACERVQAGLARLRRRLDGPLHGRRRSWSTVFLPWLRRASSHTQAASLATLAMIPLLAVSFLVALFVGPPRSGAGGAAAEPMHASARSARTADPSARLAASSVAPRSAALAPAGLQLSVASDEAHLSGVFVLPSGTPAAGATWTLEGRLKSRDLARDHGTPPGWVDPTGALDAAGRLEVAFEPHVSYSYVLTVSLAGHAAARWSWPGFEPGQHRELGAVTLRAAGRVVGAVVDPSGAPLAARTWNVYGSELDAGAGPARLVAGVGPVESDGAGRFALAGLPAGRAMLRLYDRRFGWVQGPVVDVIAGQEVEVDFVVQEAAAFAHAVVASFPMRPLRSVPGPAAEHVHLVLASGERRAATRGGGRVEFRDVGAGPVRVEVDDPRFAPWSSDALMPGAFVQAELRGSARLDFAVTTASGDPVSTFGVEGWMLGTNFAPANFTAATAGDPLPGGVLDLVPGTYHLTVEAGGVAAAVEVAALAPGEARLVPVVLDATRVVRGRVVGVGGAPVRGALVRLVRPALVADSAACPVLDERTMMAGEPSGARHMLSRALTDAEGAFALAPPASGPCLVVAGERTGPLVESARFEVGPGAALEELSLVLAEPACVVVQVAVPSGLSTAGFGVLFVPSGGGAPPHRDTSWATADDTGAFTLRAVPPGTGQLVLVPHLGPMIPGVVPAHGLVLGELTLTPGERRSVSYPYPGPPPVAVHVDLSGSAAFDAGPAQVALAPVGGGEVTIVTASSGSAGPVLVLPREYDAWVCSAAGWARLPRVTASHGSGAFAFSPALVARRIRVVDAAGGPLRSRRLKLRDAPELVLAPEWETDAEGWLDLALAAGEYALVSLAGDPLGLQGSAPFVWPIPSGAEVRLAP